MPPRKLTAAQRSRVERMLHHRPTDPHNDDRRLCQWCYVPAAERVDGPEPAGDFLCWQCGRHNGPAAYPDGIPGLTQEPETCRHCGHESEWAPGADDADKRCPRCRCDMHPEAALAAHGQTIVPGQHHPMRPRAAGSLRLSAVPFDDQYVTARSLAELHPLLDGVRLDG